MCTLINTNSLPQRNPAKCTPHTHQEVEGHRQQHAHRRHQRVPDLFVPLHRQGRNVESRAMQSVNVTPQFPPAHLESLFDFAVEVTGRLGELRQRSNRGQVLVSDDRAISKIPYPAPFEDPNSLRLRPTRARGKDSATHLKARRIKFKHRESAKEFLRGVEEIVVINLRALSENPALRMSVRMRRAAFVQFMKQHLAMLCN